MSVNEVTDMTIENTRPARHIARGAWIGEVLLLLALLALKFGALRLVGGL